MAVEFGGAKRYPPRVTPFAALDVRSAQGDLEKIVQPGEVVGLLSVIPTFEGGWRIEKQITIYQYVWQEGELSDDEEVVPLKEGDIAAMLELTALVYPAYFREETARLGPYYGVVRDNRLCAMGGIRLAMTGYQELSAICTHPDFRGQGLAAKVTSRLVQHVIGEGDTPFLHTESDNSPAQTVYERLGFQKRTELPFSVAARLST